MTLTLSRAIQDCHITLAHVEAPLYTSLGEKGEEFQEVIFEDLSSHFDLDLEDKNPNFLHDTPGHDHTTYIH